MSLIYWPIVSGPVASSSPASTDPYFSSVVQLAHFDGTNGSIAFTNSCPRGTTLASFNVAALSTAAYKFGTASLRCPSGGTSFASATGTAYYNFGTGDYTIEFWVNPDTLNLDFNSAKVYFDMRDTSLTAAWVPTISAHNASGSIRMFANGAERIFSGNNVISATAWNYIALCRNSATTRLFCGPAGGTASQVGSDFADSNTYIQSVMTIGAASNNAGECIGYFDDLRVTKGVGRYTSNFSVPTSAFPNQ